MISKMGEFMSFILKPMESKVKHFQIVYVGNLVSWSWNFGLTNIAIENAHCVYTVTVCRESIRLTMWGKQTQNEVKVIAWYLILELLSLFREKKGWALPCINKGSFPIRKIYVFFYLVQQHMLPSLDIFELQKVSFMKEYVKPSLSKHNASHFPTTSLYIAFFKNP